MRLLILILFLLSACDSTEYVCTDVLYLDYDSNGVSCISSGTVAAGCCPDGFTLVGFDNEAAVCLADQ